MSRNYMDLDLKKTTSHLATMVHKGDFLRASVIPKDCARTIIPTRLCDLTLTICQPNSVSTGPPISPSFNA